MGFRGCFDSDWFISFIRRVLGYGVVGRFWFREGFGEREVGFGC